MNFLVEHYNLMIMQFHWLRPLWLIALIPALLLSILLWRQKRKAYQWQQLISPELLPFLLDGKSVETKKSLIWILLCAWIIGCIAVAGPTWVKRPMPVEKNQSALVILLDLSYSMISEDVKPSRIARARLKIADILRERKDGQTALVAYAGEAHTVTPISDDSATILSLLSSMHPNIMPMQGSNIEDAIARSIQLFQDAGATQGDILLVTDGVVPEAFNQIESLLAGKKIQLNILGVGTTQPAPIPSANGGFLRDNSGTILTTQLNSSELTQLTARLNGRYHEISNNNRDIDYLKPREIKEDSATQTLKRDFDQWVDNGYWLVFLLLPIALFCFRRGLFLSLLLIPIIGFNPSPSYALGLDDVWLTKDQQAQRELTKGDAKKAAEQFSSPEWKATAQYRAGDYASAAEGFAKIDTPSGHYNRGNALAKSGKLQDAIKAYDEALSRDANLEDAKKNRALAEKLLKQQKEQQDQENKKNSDANNNNEKNDQSDSDKQNPDNKDGSKQNQESNNQGDKQNQESKEQEKSDQPQSDNQSSDGSSGKDQSAESSQQSSRGTQENSQIADKGQSSQSSSAGPSQSPMKEASQSSSAGSSAINQTQQPLQAGEKQLTPEQQQAFEQWLRRVPDDPAGLLRNKFKYQYDLNRQKQSDGELTSPANNADQRL